MAKRSTDRRTARQDKGRRRWPGPRNEKARPGERSGLEHGRAREYPLAVREAPAKAPRD